MHMIINCGFCSSSFICNMRHLSCMVLVLQVDLLRFRYFGQFGVILWKRKNGSANHSSLGNRQRKQNTYVSTSLIHRYRSMHFLHANHFNFHRAVIRIFPQKLIVSLFFIKSVNIIKKNLNLFSFNCFFTCLIFIAVWRG